MSEHEEQVVYGVRTCRAIYEARRDAIRRIYFRSDRLRTLAPILKWAAETRRVYRQVSDEELARLAKSVHHEGVAMAVTPREWSRFDPDGVAARGCWLALDRVENPHSLGMMIRTAAYFGADGVLAGGTAPGVRLSSALMRMAEGGAERVVLAGTIELAVSLSKLRARGYTVVGVDGTAPRPLSEISLPRPIGLVVGAEPDGLSAAVRHACSALGRIPGRWPAGSLSETVAAGIVLAELARREAGGCAGA